MASHMRQREMGSWKHDDGALIPRPVNKRSPKASALYSHPNDVFGQLQLHFPVLKVSRSPDAQTLTPGSSEWSGASEGSTSTWPSTLGGRCPPHLQG